MYRCASSSARKSSPCVLPAATPSTTRRSYPAARPLREAGERDPDQHSGRRCGDEVVRPVEALGVEQRAGVGVFGEPDQCGCDRAARLRPARSAQNGPATSSPTSTNAAKRVGSRRATPGAATSRWATARSTGLGPGTAGGSALRAGGPGDPERTRQPQLAGQPVSRRADRGRVAGRAPDRVPVALRERQLDIGQRRIVCVGVQRVGEDAHHDLGRRGGGEEARLQTHGQQHERQAGVECRERHGWEGAAGWGYSGWGCSCAQQPGRGEQAPVGLLERRGREVGGVATPGHAVERARRELADARVIEGR